MADDQWFYAVGSDHLGPVTRDALTGLLRDGQLHAHSLVWAPGMLQWQPAHAVPALADELARAPAAPPDFYAADLRDRAAAPPPAQPLDYGLGESQYLPADEPDYAGFWLRFVAILIDVLLLSAAAAICVLPMLLFTTDDHILTGAWELTFLALSWLYFAVMESSSRQATLGKLAMGLKVTDLNGRRITFARATGRFFAKALSYTILYVGFIMAAVSKQKQGLHDLIAGTLVVKRRSPIRS